MSAGWLILIIALIAFACRLCWRIGLGNHDRTTATAYRDGFVHGVRMMRDSQQLTNYINIDPDIVAAVLEREGWTVMRTPVKEATRVPH